MIDSGREFLKRLSTTVVLHQVAASTDDEIDRLTDDQLRVRLATLADQLQKPRNPPAHGASVSELSDDRAERVVSTPRDPIPGRPPAELPPSTIAPGGRSVPSPGGLAGLVEEVAALAALLANVVELAGQSAQFPSRWEVIAELALEHDSVRRALETEEITS